MFLDLDLRLAHQQARDLDFVLVRDRFRRAVFVLLTIHLHVYLPYVLSQLCQVGDKLPEYLHSEIF